MKINALLVIILISMSSNSFAQDNPSAQQNPSPSPSPIQSLFRFGIGASLSTLATETYHDVTRTGAPGIFEAHFDHNPAVSLELEGRYLRNHSFGTTFGLTYDFERDFDGGTVFGNGRAVSISSANPSSIQITVLYANLVYQSNAIYFPFGFNYSFFDYTPSPVFTGSADLEGDIGFQAGLGFYATSSLVFESMFRLLGTDYIESENGITTNYGRGTFNTLQLTMKYLF